MRHLTHEEKARCERVEFYLCKLYDRRVRAMARDLGVSHPLISRTVNLKQPPGRKVMKALANLEVVNELWLYEGQGEPLKGQHSGTLPLARILLPGSPDDYQQLLSGIRHPVAEQLYSPSRYWFEVPFILADSLLPDNDHPTIKPGDLMLIESNPEMLSRPDLVMHHPRVVVTNGKSVCSLEFPSAPSDPKVRTLLFETIGSLEATMDNCLSQLDTWAKLTEENQKTSDNVTNLLHRLQLVENVQGLLQHISTLISTNQLQEEVTEVLETFQHLEDYHPEPPAFPPHRRLTGIVLHLERHQFAMSSGRAGTP